MGPDCTISWSLLTFYRQYTINRVKCGKVLLLILDNKFLIIHVQVLTFSKWKARAVH